ncbi:PASTA domain-containing protein [Paludibacter sp. 221]|uniref:PASTA domain-containing protein n=1 Tax=Paludibacter sp. 221 TaxID=2302939 RepID=UPI0013D55695|nr:PASTA domain-containing protein [Paludibacter sp. 221]NDV47781.1 PASTA domain-containing protein [Paludibacter sp. 221]
MTWKNFWKKSLGGFVIKNIAVALVLFVLIVVGTFWGINKYTQHGVVEAVPDLRGAYVEEAQIILSRQGLYPQVVDSVYVRDKRLGTIIEQTPQPNATMKRNRPVYLIINSREVRKVPLPEINDYSSRQAAAMLQASGIGVESIEYAPSEYKDLVIDIKYKGESIRPGTPVPEGEAVVLIVGRGLGTEEVVIPKLKGMTLEEARYEVVSSSFILGATYYDRQTGDGETYIIYRQEPPDGKIAPSGTKIDVWFTTDYSLLESDDKDTISTSQDEEFF